MRDVLRCAAGLVACDVSAGHGGSSGRAAAEEFGVGGPGNAAAGCWLVHPSARPHRQGWKVAFWSSG
jgi:hypothetical protein